MLDPLKITADDWQAISEYVVLRAKQLGFHFRRPSRTAYDGEDAVQEVSKILVQRIAATYRPNLPFGPWLVKTVRLELKRFRQVALRKELPQSPLEEEEL